MGGVMNEKDLEAKVMRHQVSVEDVVALVPSDIIEEQMQVGENVGEHLQQMLIELKWIWKELF
jgi:hypothetical protein